MTDPKEKIPCTVAILTHNSAATLPRALESVKAFAEIIICDSNSTDTTLEIAHTYGSKIIRQSAEFLGADGRIKNFAGVRNQTLSAATQSWFFFLDSDEYISKELKEEIASICETGKPKAYWVPRKYVLNGIVIDHASTYPNQQMRFFNRSCAERFIKEVHERIQLKDGVTTGRLTAYMLVPLPPSAGEMMQKWRSYLHIEAKRHSGSTLRRALAASMHETLVGCLYLLRTIKITFFSRGTKLPLSYELARVWYQGALVRLLLSRIRRV